MSRKWSWDAKAARRINGYGNPVDREAAVRDTDGRVVPEWRRKAVLPPDFRRPEDAGESPHLNPELFAPRAMWSGYFPGPQNEERFDTLDAAVRDGKCVGLGCKPCIYSVDQIAAQIYAP